MSKWKHRIRRERTHSCRFLTFSCYHRLQLFNNDSIKDCFVEHLAAARLECGFGLIAWVVMPDHVHLLIWPRVVDAPIPTVMSALKTEFAKQVIGRWRELDAAVLPRITDSRGDRHFWQRGGGYDRNIGAGAEYKEKFGYIHANPVRRKLAERAVDWKWSSVRWYRQPEAYVGPPCDPVWLPGTYEPDPNWCAPDESVEGPATPAAPRGGAQSCSATAPKATSTTTATSPHPPAHSPH
jgi:putative transposase